MSSVSFSGSGQAFYLTGLFLFHQELNQKIRLTQLGQRSGRTSGLDQQESQEFASLKNLKKKDLKATWVG